MPSPAYLPPNNSRVATATADPIAATRENGLMNIDADHALARASSHANAAPTSPNTAPSPSVLASSAASIASGRENATANFSRPSAPDVALAHSAPSSAGSSVLPNSASTAPTATPIGRAMAHGTIRLEMKRPKAAVRADDMDGLPKTWVHTSRSHQPSGRFSGRYAPSGEPHSAGLSIAPRGSTRRTQAAIRGRTCLMRPTAADQSRESPAWVEER